MTVDYAIWPNVWNVIQHHVPFLFHLEEEAAAVSTTVFTLLLVITTIEAVILVLFTVYSWFRLPMEVGRDFWWVEDDDDVAAAAAAAGGASGQGQGQLHRWMQERNARIEATLTEFCWNQRLLENPYFHGHEQESSCPICLTNYRWNEMVVGSSDCCPHVFHKSCLVRWLFIQTTCPCCRQELLTTTTTASPLKTPSLSLPQREQRGLQQQVSVEPRRQEHEPPLLVEIERESTLQPNNSSSHSAPSPSSNVSMWPMESDEYPLDPAHVCFSFF